MLIDARSLPTGQTVISDLCIIGGGPAGLILANELAATGLKITLVETGGEKTDANADSLSSGRATSEKYAPLNMYRRRVLGGASTIWGGRIIPYDPIDFEVRDYVPNSGWPISYDAILPYYRLAAPYFEVGEPTFDAREALAAFEPFIAGFDDPDVLSTAIERFSPPTNLWRTNRAHLVAAPNVTILGNATCVKLALAGDPSEITSAECVTLANTRLDVKAKRFVLACGGIETVRLLGNSNDVHPNGLGNANDCVGRYFMSHIEGSIGRVHLKDPKTPVKWDFERTPEGIYTVRRFTLSPAVQRRERIENFMIRLHHDQAADPRHGSAVLSLMFLAKNFILPEYRRKISMVERATQASMPKGTAFWAGHLGNIAWGASGLAVFVTDWIYRRNIQYRRVPYVTLPSARGVYPIDFNSEQIPNPESRIRLGSETDRFGLREAVVDWHMMDEDVFSIGRAFSVMKAAFAQSKLADFVYPEDSILDRIRAESVPIGGHHIGVTRMSADPRKGVVDSNLKVHDLANLYVLGSSVFPTSSHANPTFTIGAMAVRLANHLKA